MNRFLALLATLLLLCASPLYADQSGVPDRVRVGIFPLEPLNYIDNDGTAQGFNPDLLREIARLQGWSLSFVPGSWSQGLNRLQTGEIDLMMMVNHSPERALVMDYTVESAFEVWGQVFVRPNSRISSITDLDGLPVALMRKDMNGQNFKTTAKELGVVCDYLEFDNFAEVFAAVKKDQAIAGVAPQFFGLRHASDYELAPSSIQFSPGKTYFTSKKGQQQQLLSQIDQQLKSWKQDKDSYYYQRLAYWLGGKPLTERIPGWVWSALLLVCVATLLSVAASVLFRSQVRKRTSELLAKDAALRKSQKDYREIFDASNDAIFIHDVQTGQILDVNRSMLQMFGYSKEAALKINVGDLSPNVPPYTQEEALRRIQAAVKEGPQVFEWLAKHSNGEQFWVEVALNSYQPENRQLVIAATRDISRRRQLEEEHRRLEEQLLQTQKVESLGVLAGGIAHDFNNILMAILGHCELALRRINQESPAKANLEQIKNSANKAADLTNQMLAYSGRGKFVVEPHDLTQLIAEMEQMLRVSISKKVVVRYDLVPHLPTIDVDATQMRQIIMNLAINASDAIGERSGVIAISTGVMDCDQNYLRETWLDENLPAGQYVFLEVADSGCGMDKATLERIFEPFFTTKFTGRGLGMAAVLGIVRGHKGAIKIYSEVGKGTTFKVLFPATSKPAVLFDHEQSLPQFEGSGLVLLVDDDETVRSIGRSMLEELGFEVLTANDGRDALSVYEQQFEKIRFVLMDLTMPHLDGEQAFREMRRLNTAVKVILSSGYNEQDVAQRFIGKGLSGFLKKPYQLSILQEAIRKLLIS